MALPAKEVSPVMKQTNAAWWSAIEAMISATKIVIDRPAGSVHPRFPCAVYPLDYGYLAGTNGGDGAGIDVWVGESKSHRLCAAVICVDRLKGEIEAKLLLGCTEGEIESVRRFHSEGHQVALVLRPLRTPPVADDIS
jgi:inorganic pyrophosphatase